MQSSSAIVCYVLRRLHNALTSPVRTEVTDSVTEVPICLITLTGPGMEEAGLFALAGTDFIFTVCTL